MIRGPAGQFPLPLPLLLATCLVALPVVRPAAIDPRSTAGCAVLAAIAAVVLARYHPLLSRDVTRGLLMLLPLAATAVLLAPSRARAIDESVMLLVLLIAGLLGVVLARDPRAPAALSLLLAGLGTIAAIIALVQHHILYPEQLRNLGADPGIGAEPFIVRLAAGRPSGPFILPAALGGFLALSLPPLVAWALRARRVALRGAAGAAIVLQGYALMLTRSFGALIAVGIAGVVLVPLLGWRGRRRAAIAIVIAVLAGGVFFFQARRDEIAHAPGSDPISLRLGNWSAAARMIADHSIVGVGPGAFGTAYPRYMRPGMNQTRYAHNTYLQFAATWGAWSLLPLGALLFGVGRSGRRHASSRDPRLPLTAGAIAFLAHNLIDFTAYLPGIALPAALLIGVSLGRADLAASPERAWRRTRPTPALAAVLIAILLVVHALPAARAGSLLTQAGIAIEQGGIDQAADLVVAATHARPEHPDAWAFLSEMTLVNWRDDPDRWSAGRTAAERAVALDPESAIRHYNLSLYHRAAGEGALAYREQLRAHRLYPLKPLYRMPAPAGGQGTR